MANYGLYFILVACWFATVATGSRALIYAAAALIPASQVMPSLAGPPTSPSNLILMGFMAMCFVHRKKISLSTASIPLKGPMIFMSLMLVLGLLIRGASELQGHDFLYSFLEATKDTWYRITPFVIFALMFRLAGEARVRDRVVTWCQITIVLEGAITIVERAMGSGRATAHLGEANRAGAYFAAAIPFFLASFLMEPSKKKWLYLGASVFPVIGLFNSLSRGGMLAAACGCLVVVGYAFLSGRGQGTAKLFLVAAGVLLVLNFAVVVPKRVQDRVLETFGGSVSTSTGQQEKLDASAEERLELWSIGWALFRDDPFGYGNYTYQDLVLPFHGKVKVAHNIYLQILVENGVQGLLGVLFLIGAVYLRLFRTLRESEDRARETLALSLVGWWTSHIVAHFFVNTFFQTQVTGQFWMMAACLLASPKTATEKVEVPVPARASLPRLVTRRGPRPVAAGGAR